MFNTELGTVGILGPTPYLRTKVGLAGHALYGPYEYLAPGIYEAVFFVEIPNRDRNDRGKDEIYVVADVVSNFGSNVIARKEFTIGSIDHNALRLEIRFQLLDVEIHRVSALHDRNY